MALAVAHVGGNVTTGSATITSDSWSSAAGSLIVVILHVYNTGGAAAGGDITDAKSNTYTLVTSSFGGASAPGIAMYYNNGGTRGASHTVTGNLVNSAGESDNIAVVEITGHDTTTPLDSTTFATATDTTSPFSVTAAAAISGNQIAVYGCTIDTGTNTGWTEATGYTVIINQGNGVTSLVSDASYKINETGTPSPGASGTWTTTAVREIFATFNEAAASGLDVPLLCPIPQFNVHRM